MALPTQLFHYMLQTDIHARLSNSDAGITHSRRYDWMTPNSSSVKEVEEVISHHLQLLSREKVDSSTYSTCVSDCKKFGLLSRVDNATQRVLERCVKCNELGRINCLTWYAGSLVRLISSGRVKAQWTRMLTPPFSRNLAAGAVPMNELVV